MSKLKEQIKNNKFFFLVLVAYIVMFLARPRMGVSAVRHSGFFIKEMLLIMPVIFILTALLDLWVPKEKILQYLGRESGLKGLILSFVIGSVSAGPLYAAFPMCIMLYNKGASLRNLVVILSSWAVIKIPMLLNELRFLGFRFMAVRWVLTVLAIVIFSRITARIVKPGDLEIQASPEREPGLTVDREACIGCSVCAEIAPEHFEMRDKKAHVIEGGVTDPAKAKEAAAACPVDAIHYAPGSEDES